MKIAVTGATGFVGGALIKSLEYWDVLVLGRSSPPDFKGQFVSLDIALPFEARESLRGVDVLVHCAARVHIMNDKVDDPLKVFRQVNVEGTVRLARQAADAGVGRFIFISSVKVNGESTTGRAPFDSKEAVAPQDAYGISKSEAEDALFRLAQTTGMEVVVIRPPLVYGKGVRANFAALMRLATLRIPLPFSSVKNRRSFVSVDNLVDLIKICVDHPAAANNVFLASDGSDFSTPDLLRAMASASHRGLILLPFPVWLLQRGCALLGKRAIADRLFGDLQVDISHTTQTLGWRPKKDTKEGIRSMLL